MASVAPIASTPLLSPTPFALDLPEELSFDQWRSIGHRLCRAGQGLNWHIGDWWAFGERQYGDRAAAAAEGIFGLEFGTLANLATVSRAFETSRRREHLSFTHHAEVAALPSEAAEQLLEKAEREHLSTRDLRREAQVLKGPASPRVSTNEHPSNRPDLSEALQMVIELAEALEQHRELTEREGEAVAVAGAYLDSTGYWSPRDRAYLETLAERRDWIEEAQAKFPNRTVAAIRCMMQKVRAELGLTQPRYVDGATQRQDRLMDALTVSGQRPG
jgi:hypothetical protein